MPAADIAGHLLDHVVFGFVMRNLRRTSTTFLPSDSPELNPIKQVFAKLKSLIPSAAPRTCKTLWTGMGTMLNRLQLAECRSYLTNTGYGRSA